MISWVRCPFVWVDPKVKNIAMCNLDYGIRGTLRWSKGRGVGDLEGRKWESVIFIVFWDGMCVRVGVWSGFMGSEGESLILWSWVYVWGSEVRFVIFLRSRGISLKGLIFDQCSLFNIMILRAFSLLIKSERRNKPPQKYIKRDRRNLDLYLSQNKKARALKNCPRSWSRWHFLISRGLFFICWWWFLKIKISCTHF